MHYHAYVSKCGKRRLNAFIFQKICHCWYSKYNLDTCGENTSPQRAAARGRLFMSCQCDWKGGRKCIKKKYHFEGKMGLSEMLPQPFIISFLLSLHKQFYPYISLLFSMVVTNSALPEFQVLFQLCLENKGKAKLHFLKWILTNRSNNSV